MEGQHSTFLISLELYEQEHEDGNDSVSDDNSHLIIVFMFNFDCPARDIVAS